MTGTIGTILFVGALGGGGLLAYHEYTVAKAKGTAAATQSTLSQLEAEGEKLISGSGNPLSDLYHDLTGSDSGTEDSNPTMGNTGSSSSGSDDSGGDSSGEDPSGGGNDDNSD